MAALPLALASLGLISALPLVLLFPLGLAFPGLFALVLGAMVAFALALAFFPFPFTLAWAVGLASGPFPLPLTLAAPLAFFWLFLGAAVGLDLGADVALKLKIFSTAVGLALGDLGALVGMGVLTILNLPTLAGLGGVGLGLRRLDLVGTAFPFPSFF